MKSARQRVNQLEKMLEPKEEPISFEIVIYGRNKKPVEKYMYNGREGKEYFITGNDSANEREQVNPEESEQIEPEETIEPVVTRQEIEVSVASKESKELERIDAIERNIQDIKSGKFTKEPELEIIISPPKKPPVIQDEKRKEEVSPESLIPRSEIERILDRF